MKMVPYKMKHSIILLFTIFSCFYNAYSHPLPEGIPGEGLEKIYRQKIRPYIKEYQEKVSSKHSKPSSDSTVLSQDKFPISIRFMPDSYKYSFSSRVKENSPELSYLEYGSIPKIRMLGSTYPITNLSFSQAISSDNTKAKLFWNSSAQKYTDASLPKILDQYNEVIGYYDIFEKNSISINESSSASNQFIQENGKCIGRIIIKLLCPSPSKD
jgi:hypothetical protein